MSQQMEIDELVAKSETTSKPLTLQVLDIVRRSQLKHGLKHGDYRRYRKYCSKRLHRIRRAVNFIQASGSGGRNNRGHFQKKTLNTELVFDTKKGDEKHSLRLLYIPLIAAERAWAYSLELKQEASSGGENQPRKRFHMLRRLEKAVRWSLKLSSLCNQDNSRVDARTKLETTAYALYMRGLLLFERQRWQRAANALQKAENIYQKLTGVINDEEELAFYQQRVEEIKPTLRYCSFNIADSQGMKDVVSKIKTMNIDNDQSKIDQLLKQTTETGQPAAEVAWLGKTIFVKHDLIRLFLASLRDDKNEHKWQELSFFEEMIFECRDCLQLLRDANQSKSSLYLYLTYLRLDLIIRRNLKLIQGLTNVSDILRQYESVIGCLNEIKSLPLTQFADEFKVAQFGDEIEAQVLVYKAYRCYYIGHVPAQAWKETVALLHRAGIYCREALASEFLTDKQQKDEMHKLLAKADAEKFAIYGQNIANENSHGREKVEDEDEKELEEKTADKQKPLIERLESFVNDQALLRGELNLVNFPPDYRAVPFKPLFFDLALNHVRFPDLEEEINASKSKAGLTGMVKGWLGGWRK